MTPADFDYLRKCLKERSGLVLSADKQYLVESRLLPVARSAGFANLGEPVRSLPPDRDAGTDRGAKQRAHNPHLVRRRLDGAGALLVGNVPA